MKLLFASLFIFIYVNYSLAQKPAIDSTVYGKWPSVGGGAISNDGNYVMYTIENRPTGSRTLVLRATHTGWTMEIIAPDQVSFTQDSRMAVLIKPNDSLGIITLGESIVNYIPHVISFKLPDKGTPEWLAYQLNTPEMELVVKNLSTGNEKIFANVSDYLFNDQGNILLLQMKIENDSKMNLLRVRLADSQTDTIWAGAKATNFCFDRTGTQLAFIASTQNAAPIENLLYYYKTGGNKAGLLINKQSPEIDSGWSLDNIQGFDKDGNSLFFTVKQIAAQSEADPDAVKVDIWSYKDLQLQSAQLKEKELPHSYTAGINIQDRRIIRLGQEDDELISIISTDGSDEKFGFIKKSYKGDREEPNWNPATRSFYYLVSMKDGSRVRQKGRTINFKLSAIISPEGKYIIYYDPKTRNYISYEVLSGAIRNITQNIHTTWTIYNNDNIDAHNISAGVSGWLKNDASVFLHDQNDVWLVDLAGQKPPVNLTNGYGRKHNISFRLSEKYMDLNIATGETVILTAFNRTNKNNGFYSKILGKAGDPLLLTMGPYIYDIPGILGESPIKANTAEVYLVKRMSATESPNYFLTTDFKTYKPISTIHPEIGYNWLKTELVTWKTFDGSISQGLLYKPENFDPEKTYPLIIYYYEKLSDQLHLYLAPAPASGPINIPWFVSNGYIVFTPDIHYKTGNPGKSAYNSIVSAACLLSKMSWADSKRIGIQGHSFGGYETNYIVTHTGIFAAAMSAAGVSDCISDYGSLWGSGSGRQLVYEDGQMRIGNTLWERPDLYIKNSPLFEAKKVTTPLLMMNNLIDRGVPFTQGLELFVALRRLGKKVWMLQYDGEDHSIVNDKAKRDYTARLTQFFDHYLKGVPAPKWMAEGIPARLKGIDTGLEMTGIK